MDRGEGGGFSRFVKLNTHPPPSVDIKSRWNYISTSPNAFKGMVVKKAQGQYETLYLNFRQTTFFDTLILGI